MTEKILNMSKDELINKLIEVKERKESLTESMKGLIDEHTKSVKLYEEAKTLMYRAVKTGDDSMLVAELSIHIAEIVDTITNCRRLIEEGDALLHALSNAEKDLETVLAVKYHHFVMM